VDVNYFIYHMRYHAQAIRELTQGISEDQGRWKPDTDSWSILEVINHLYDEEREDFRVRLDYILNHPDKPFPPIDPQGWVTERTYNKRSLPQSTNNFIQERQKSLDWLNSLDKPDWNTTYTSQFGEIRAGDMFAAWVAHDLLHLRQIIELHYNYTYHITKPYSTGYAGDF